MAETGAKPVPSRTAVYSHHSTWSIYHLLTTYFTAVLSTASRAFHWLGIL